MDGFVLQGEFKKEETSKNGIPKNYPHCLNPKLVKIINEKKCTRELTGEQKVFYGQVLYAINDKFRHSVKKKKLFMFIILPLFKYFIFYYYIFFFTFFCIFFYF